jgi:Tfp pilus assembly protein PilO
MTSNERSAIVLVAIAGIALLAAVWFVAIGPKRSASSEVHSNVASQEQRLQAAQAQLRNYQGARKQFPGMLAELRTLDKAVPAQAAISSLLRQVQRRANVRDSELRLVALKSASAVPAVGTSAEPVTPGATVGPEGLSAMPFTFEFTGKYFDLRDILATVRRSVGVHHNGDVKVSGRLLTIDGVTFTRADPTSTLTKAVVNATAYIAPDGAKTPQPPAAAAAAKTAGGS